MPKQESKKKEYRVFLPSRLAEEIEELVEIGLYDNTSEAIRDIVREWYKNSE